MHASLARSWLGWQIAKLVDDTSPGAGLGRKCLALVLWFGTPNQLNEFVTSNAGACWITRIVQPGISWAQDDIFMFRGQPNDQLSDVMKLVVDKRIWVIAENSIFTDPVMSEPMP